MNYAAVDQAVSRFYQQITREAELKDNLAMYHIKLSVIHL